MAYAIPAYQPIALNFNNAQAKDRKLGLVDKVAPAPQPDILPLLHALQLQPLRAAAVKPYLNKSMQVAPPRAMRGPRNLRGRAEQRRLGHREDKFDFGRRHTVIEGANGRRFQLLNSLSLRSEADILQILKDVPAKHVERIGSQLKIIVGQGGFGKVRLALAEDTGEIMIAKKMSPRDGLEEIQKFSLLARLPSSITQHMITLNDYAIVPGQNGETKAYLFETLMTAGDCANTQDSAILEIPNSILNRLSLAEMLLKPIKGLHEHGLYHRDIKPENYLKNGHGDVKLADPGLMTQHKTPKDIAGTPLFMPPEAQFRGAQADKADDFALGIMLYQLSGKGKAHPAEDYTVIDKRGKQRLPRENEELLYSKDFLKDCETARQTNTQGSVSLWSLALHLMHPDPKKRLSTTEALRGVQHLKNEVIAILDQEKRIQEIRQQRLQQARQPHYAAGLNFAQPIAVY